MLRLAGWCSGVFFLLLGVYFEIIALCILSNHPRNAAEWIPSAIYPLVPLMYGITVIWRLNVPTKKPAPQVPENDKNDAELAALIQRLKSKQVG